MDGCVFDNKGNRYEREGTGCLSLFLGVLFWGCLTGVLYAQDTLPGRRVPLSGFTELVGRDYIDSAVVRILKENSPSVFDIPDVPRFAIIGNDNRFYLGIGGAVKGTVSYDFRNPLCNPMYFVVGDIPTDNPPANDGKYNMTVGGSNIFFNFVGMPGSKYQVGAYVNFDFENDDYMFDLQYAYLTINGFLFGYSFTMFSDQSVVPPTIDMEGPPVLPSVQSTVLNYTHEVGGWSFGVGVEMPRAEMTVGEGLSVLDQKIPAVPAFVQYEWNEKRSSVRVAGLWHNMQYMDSLSGKSEDEMGWGVQLTGKWNFSRFTAYYLGLYGEGVSSFTQDLCGRGMDLLPAPDGDGKMQMVKMWGGMLGFRFNLTDKWFASATYSHLRCYADRYEGGCVPYDDQIRYEQYAVGNLFCSLTANTMIGIEYVWGRKVTMDYGCAANNRVQAMWQFNF